MFVLQDCSICYDEYHDRLHPHMITCGHVFCRPCLDTIGSDSSRCPICRTSFNTRDIRKIIGGRSEKRNEQEKTIWSLLKLGADSEDNEFRRTLYNSAKLFREADTSEHVCIALNIGSMLVQAEHDNLQQQKRLRNATLLEAQLRIELVQSQLKQLTIQESQFTSNNTLSSPRRSQPPGPETLHRSPAENFSSSESSSRPHRTSSGRQASQSLSATKLTTPRQNDTLRPKIAPMAKQARLPQKAAPAQNASQKSELHRCSSGFAASRTALRETYQTIADMLDPPRAEVAVATYNFAARNSYELSIEAGEQLKLFPGWDMNPSSEWVMCERGHEPGGVGFVPKVNLQILGIDV